MQRKTPFLLAELSSELGEKEILTDSKQPTAPPSRKSHKSYGRSLKRENGGRRYIKHNRTSLRRLLRVAAVDSAHRPHPSSLHICFRTRGEQVGHLNDRPVLRGFFPLTSRFPMFRLGDWFT